MKNEKVSLAISAINSIDNIDDLHFLQEVFKNAHARLMHHKGNEFFVGQEVYFNDKHDRLQRGHVTKINSKTVKVHVPMTNVAWSVSPTFLKAA